MKGEGFAGGYNRAMFVLLDGAVNKHFYETDVSILIAAYNEDDSIEDTLRNKPGLENPKPKLEIMVLSDVSTHKTDNIVQECTERGLKPPQAATPFR